MTVVDGCAGYVPLYRIDREEIADQHGDRASGESAVPARDENHVTMASEAATTALDRSSVDARDLGAVLSASTTDPFAEHGVAAQVAYRIDAPDAVRTGDFRGTTRAATDALVTGRDLVEAREAPVLVVASDVMPAEPGTDEEAEAGAGAGAVVLAPDADDPTAILTGVGEATTAFVERHREHGAVAEQGDDRFERRYGARPAIGDALERAGAGNPAYGVAVAAEGRAASGVFREGDAEHVTTRETVGFAGPASFLLDLAYCLESADSGAADSTDATDSTGATGSAGASGPTSTVGTTGAAVCYGAGGADAVAFETGTVGNAGPTVADQLDAKEYVSYAKHLEYREPVDYQGVPSP